MKKISKISGIILSLLLAAVLLCTAALAINETLNNSVKLKRYTFEHTEVPKSFDGYKIFVISDLHNAPFTEKISEYIELTAPDIILMTGDMAQLPDHSVDEAAEIALRFSKEIPIFAISGNHESQNEAYMQIYEALYWQGVRWLENEYEILKKNGEEIFLMGIRDSGENDISPKTGKVISDFIKESVVDKPEFSIVMNHRADLYPYLKNSDCDLILSGHLHGGIVRLPFIGGLIGKTGEISFPDYDYGLIREDFSSAMIVSGGCDKNPKKKRYFNPPEVLLITLESDG